MPVSGRKWAFLSNCLTSAIEAEGSIDWFPCPSFDSPSIFTKLLDDRTGGYFSIRTDDPCKISTDYFEDSLIVRNLFTTKRGELEVKDVLPIGLSSIIRVYKSTIPFIVDINPLFGYGLINPGIEYVNNGLVFKNNSSQEGLEVSIKGKYTVVEDGILRFDPGKGSIFAVYSKDLRYGLFSNTGFVYPDPIDALDKTAHYWHEQMMLGKQVAMHKEAYKRSVLTVLGLVYQPSGAIIAAPTTSLPEVVGEGRNWDYRYLWIRDGSYAAEALASVGYLTRARRILDFMIAVIDPPSKSFDHPLYTIDGEPPQPEETLGWLNGYLGSKPVRVGNAAYMQIQMDSEGAFMNALYDYIRLSHNPSYAIENWWAIESIVEWTSGSWKKPSTSLWEERDTLAHVVHTKVMQWVAVDRAYKIAEMVGYKQRAKGWQVLANRIKSDILEKGFSKKLNSFTRYYGSSDVDAALLCLPLYGFIDANDPRFASTLRRIEKELMVEDGLLLRHRSDYQGRTVHPFTLLSTWLARVYLRQGNKRRAEQVLKKLISCSTDMLLFGEHVERKTLEPRGNFPQCFPHAGLLMAIAEYNNAPVPIP